MLQNLKKKGEIIMNFSNEPEHVKPLTESWEGVMFNQNPPCQSGLSKPCQSGQPGLEGCRQNKYTGTCQHSVVCNDHVTDGSGCQITVICDIRITAPCPGGSMTNVTPCTGTSLPRPCNNLTAQPNCQRVVTCGNWNSMQKPGGGN